MVTKEATKETGLLRKAESTTAYAKIGLFGFPGTGKTYLACNIAIGLYKYLKCKKPVAFIDTENGSDFSIPRFKEAKIQLLTAKTRAFTDLVSILHEAEKSCSILIIDSISHFWVEIQRAYMKKKHIDRMLFQHWLPVKTEWRESFTDLFLNSKLHIISVARASWIYGFEEDDEGRKELIKEGAQMKVEAEFGYEPSLVLQLERMRVRPANTKSQLASEYFYRCYVNKDRADKINGKYFDDAVFENFLPHINFLNIGGKHFGVDTTRTSEALFDRDDSGWVKQKRKETALQDIQNQFLDMWDSRSRFGRMCINETIRTIFGVSCWKAFEQLDVDHIEKCLIKLKKTTPEDIEAMVRPRFEREEKIKKGEKSKKKEGKKNV